MKTDFLARTSGATMTAIVSSLLVACAGGGASGVQGGLPPSTPPPQMASTTKETCPQGGLLGFIGCLDDYYNGSSSSSGWSWSNVPSENPLSHASWGPWAESGDRLGAPTGALTPPEAIPKTGVAEYSGLAFGRATNGEWFEYGVTGTANVFVDFATADVDARIHFDDVGFSLTPTPLDISATGLFKGNTYSGSGQGYFSGTPGSRAGVSGAFFGPNASETAGTFFYGDGSPIDLNIRGTFGAKICPAGPGNC